MKEETQAIAREQALAYLRQQEHLYGPVLYGIDEKRAFAALENRGGLEDLEKRVQTCQTCGLARSRCNTVFGEGDRKAKIMLVGEAPGAEEDRSGRPFVGEAGQLLTKILAAIGFKRDEVFIANILKCRPPQNRDPSPEEIQNCLPFLKRQIELIHPALILALGRFAARTLLGMEGGLQDFRKKVQTYDSIPVIVTYHPAALLRHPQWKRAVWEDVQELRRLYDELVGEKPAWPTD